MEQITSQLSQFADSVPTSWKVAIGVAVVLSPYVGRAYHALVNGGGIKGVMSAIWLGTNTPKKENTNEAQKSP